MGYLRGFVPWIVFAVVSSFDWRWAAVCAAAAGVLLLAQDRRAGIAVDERILDLSAVVYFVVLGAVAFAAPDSPLESYDGAVSFGWLALTAWGTLVVGRPFTVGIAKRQTPRAYWDRPEFLRVNVVITAVWATAFTLLAAALAIVTATDAPTWTGIGCHVIGLAAPAVFTSSYPARVQARRAAAS